MNVSKQLNTIQIDCNDMKRIINCHNGHVDENFSNSIIYIKMLSMTEMKKKIKSIFFP